MANRAIWLDSESQLSIRTIDDYYEPLEGEVLVEVLYSGVNPADIRHGRVGFYESVAGYDFAGRVIKPGPGKEGDFEPGQHVLGFGAPLLDKPKQYGVHQQFHCARHFLYHVPPAMPLPDAACLMVVTHTAADAIFNQLRFSLEPSSSEISLPLLVWGGGSAVGNAAIQFAKKAGCYPIITTASPKNHDMLLSLGATECFDYNDDQVAQKIQEALRNYTSKPLQRVFDAVVATTTSPSSTAICEALVDDSSDNLFTSSVPPPPNTAKYHWSRTFCCRNVDVDFKLPNGKFLKHHAEPVLQAEIDRATRWAIENYGKSYRMPNVVVVKGGEKGMQAMIDSALGKTSMVKYVIEHPI